jgi:hypothetical protein
MKKKDLDIVLLKNQYKTLSEIREKFQRKSNHSVCKFLENKMEEILFEIEHKTVFVIPSLKKSEIVSSVYDKPYTLENGEVIHYYKLIFKNGDRGICAVPKVYSYRITVGSKLSYILKNNQIEFILQELNEKTKLHSRKRTNPRTN